MLGVSFFANATPRPSSINPSYVSLALPHSSMNFSDLDVRDKNNRKIKSISARRDLENLFVTGLHSLLIHNLTPARRLILEKLAITWNRFSEWLTTSVKLVNEKFSSWIQERKIYTPLAAWVQDRIQSDSEANRLGQYSQRRSFQFLVKDILSSTVLLR